MEERVKAIEEVVQRLCEELDETRDVLKMHIRYHIAEYDPVNQIAMRGTTENGIGYSWGNYYRAKINEGKIQPNKGI